MADDLEKDLSRSEKLLKDRLTKTGKIVKDITNKAFRELVKNINEYSRSLDDISYELEKQVEIYSDIKKQTKSLGDALNRNLNFIKDSKDLSQNLVRIFKEQNNLNEKLVRNKEDLLTGELSSKKVNDDLLKVNTQSLNILLRQRDINDEIERQKHNLVGASADEQDSINIKLIALNEINEELNLEQSNLTNISNELEKQAKSAKDIEDKVGVGAKLLSGFKKIPVLGDLLDMDGVEKAMRATAANGGSMFATLGAGAKALGSSLKAALGPVGLLIMAVEAIKAIGKFFLDAMFAADERVTKLAKGMSLTKDEARGVYSSLKETKLSMESIYNLTKDVTEAYTDLVDLTGFVTSATDEMIEAQIVLTKNIGLSKEEAFGVQEAFAAFNTDAKVGYDIVNNQLAAFANQNKLLSTGKVIFNDIAKTSKLIQINFKGNLGSLVKTTLEAKKLGLSLDQVSKIGSSLLNFEESISSELEAELLTGRDINLEKARLYALNHDIAGLTQEISRQGITQDSFSKMNVIQQEAIAKSLGMSAEEMGDMLYKQQVLEKVGGQTLKNLRERAKATKDINLQAKVDALEQGILSGKSFEESEKAASAQEKFNQALEQAKELFTDFIDGGYLDLLADAIKEFADMMLSAEDKEKKAIKRGEEMRNSEEYKKLTPEQQKYIDEQQKIVEENQVGLGGKFISALTPDINILGSDVDYYAGMERYRKAADEKLQQIQSKGFKGTTTEINAEDFVIRTLPEDTVVGMGGTALGRTDEMVKLLIQQNQHLDKQNTLLASIYNKEGTIVLNGTKMGTGMNVGGYKTA
jgi:hypothetical protein